MQNNAFIFSGFKTYHSLSEVGLALTDADGHVKPFDTFRRDVEAVDSTYNTNYLYACISMTALCIIRARFLSAHDG